MEVHFRCRVVQQAAPILFDSLALSASFGAKISPSTFLYQKLWPIKNGCFFGKRVEIGNIEKTYKLETQPKIGPVVKLDLFGAA